MVAAALAAAPAHAETAEPSATDRDADGIDDATELSLAKSYFPYFSISPREPCSRHGVLFRLAPHPSDSTKVAIWYAVLFERDCGFRGGGIGGHVGDDEVFGAIIDPEKPPPAGILGLRAISHQNTTCERVTTCGSLPGCAPCATALKDGRPYPVIFSSYSKHGGYASESACDRWPCDLMACDLNPTPDSPRFVNAGEPGHALVEDLTKDGFVTPEEGWSEPALMHFNPWGKQRFGGAGEVTDDFTDASFLISPSGCDGSSR